MSRASGAGQSRRAHVNEAGEEVRSIAPAGAAVGFGHRALMLILCVRVPTLQMVTPGCFTRAVMKRPCVVMWVTFVVAIVLSALPLASGAITVPQVQIL